MSEDLSGIFKPEAKPIMKIFGDADSYYHVPDYQRPYSWKDEQIEQLWDDIYSAMESDDESYFLGPIILVRRNDGYLEVVDGQQRLTTLTILFCVLRDLYLKDDKRIQNAVRSLVDQKPRLRLVTQSNHLNQFRQEIIDEVKFPEENLTRKQKEEDKFINCALIFRNRLRAIEALDGSIASLADYLMNKVIMISITCSNQSFAIKLFQVINTRGLDLSNADLIKSHLYEKCEENERGPFVATWAEAETIAKQMDESLADLLTYYEYHLLAGNPKRSLYEELTHQFKGKNPNRVIWEFKRFVECFNDIQKMESKVIFSLWYLPNQVFWKAILTTALINGFSDFDGLCKELRRVYYSYWIAGYTTSKIKQLSFNLIGWLKEKKTLAGIRAEIADKMLDDNTLDRMLENLQNDAYGEPWLKPLLALIEYEQTDNSKNSFIELDSRLHVDHVLPEKWDSIRDWREHWREHWTEDQADRWLRRIGNLTLLSGKKNISASNDSFDRKKRVYGKGNGGITAFEISKKIMEKPQWAEKDVKNRQEWMLKQIESVLGPYHDANAT